MGDGGSVRDGWKRQVEVEVEVQWRSSAPPRLMKRAGRMGRHEWYRCVDWRLASPLAPPLLICNRTIYVYSLRTLRMTGDNNGFGGVETWLGTMAVSRRRRRGAVLCCVTFNIVIV